MSRVFILSAIAMAALARGNVALAIEQTSVFQRTFETGIKDPVSVSVAVSAGNVYIGYSRDDQITVYAYGTDPAGKKLPQEYFKSNLVIEQKDGQVSIRDSSGVPAWLGSVSAPSINYRIDVPYRAEVESIVSGAGNQTLIGVYGPAKLISGSGDIDARYVRFATLYASTGKGNISCIRDLQVDVRTDAGNITLMEDGNSKAVVKSGHGKIEVGGARGAVDASTDGGLLHIKAALQDNWQLNSESGSIRVELPPKSKFEIEANSDSGEIAIDRDDMQKSDDETHHLQQQVNGGGKHITVRSTKGSITIE